MTTLEEKINNLEKIDMCQYNEISNELDIEIELLKEYEGKLSLEVEMVCDIDLNKELDDIHELERLIEGEYDLEKVTNYYIVLKTKILSCINLLKNNKVEPIII